MRVLMINSVCGIRGTGRICTDIAEEFEKQGHEVKIAYGRATVPEKYQKFAVKIGTNRDLRLHGIMTRITDKHGLGSCNSTKKFLEWADEYKPDLLWLHNIHGYYLNYELLFDWIKKRPKMEVRWTLHDCWAFTGHCAYFSNINCEKWKEGCKDCPQKHTYPASFIKDESEDNYARKKEAFCGVSNMSIITPSQWLCDLAKQSFLKEYKFTVIKNEIDKNIFKPTPGDFRKKYNLENKKMVLGVANIWDKRKGYHDFLKLAKLLPEEFAIVMVGLTKKQLKEIPSRIIGIGHTDSAKELAEIYTAADVFVNTTYEDNYPTVNLEAEACGTRVFTYNTGGCWETINRQDSIAVPCDINVLAKTIAEGLK